ncbi:hypothetical protein PWT90_03013 [Aphanocladium album]|nr:hypothetical protein PWT90_03013 [Aphanocladium album]
MATLNIDKASYQMLIQDVFLLPELPNENNDKPFITDLPKLLEYALANYEGLFPEDCKARLRQCRKAISNFAEIRTKITDKICGENILKLLKKDTAAAIPLYLNNHNAAVVIRWGRLDRRIDGFQLSPRVNAVSLTVGRLRRQFPEISVRIREETAAEPDFMQVIAETVAEMDKSSIRGPKPTRVVKGKESEDEFDVTLPDHVFDDFFGFLFSEQATAKDAKKSNELVKHTRDFVLHDEAEGQVIRRSPVWLLLKVVLQQELRKSGAADHTLYKQFMLVFLALLLDCACAHRFDTQTLHCMARKIGYRTRKLDSEAAGSWMTIVDNSVKRAKRLICSTWKNTFIAEKEHNAIKIPMFDSDATTCSIEHAALDRFLEKMRQRSVEEGPPVAKPKSEIIIWAADKLPNMKNLNTEPSEDDIFNVVAIDHWIEDNLQKFIETHNNDPSTCSDIKKFAIAYFKRAKTLYQGSQEHMSVMYLHMRELWIACDRIAVTCNPLLLEYTPFGVENICFDSLTLRNKQTIRLSISDIYMEARAKKKLNMIGQYGKADCFASRFARTSQLHTKLMETIEHDMAKMEQDKLTELEAAKLKQKMHFDAHENIDCDVTKCRVGTSNVPCERCSHLAVGTEMTIMPYQKLLPEDENLAYTVVFELQVPADIAAWRDFSLFLQMNVAGCTNREPQPATAYYIKNYEPLKMYFRASVLETKSRIGLASRPAKNDAAKIPVQQDLELSDISQSHPMRWKLYDFKEAKAIEKLTPGSSISKECELRLDESSKILRKILCSPSDGDGKMTQNELISMRMEAESTAIIKHNEELASFCFAKHTTWPKILRELRATSIDWTADETFLVVTHEALKAGPIKKASEKREIHRQLHWIGFTFKILEAIHRLLDIYTASFSGRGALAVFCSIALKMISDGPTKNQRDAGLILFRIRNACFEWLGDARFAHQDLTADEFEVQLDLALICAYTFNVENKHLKALLIDEIAAPQYILACAIIQESKSRVTTQAQHSLYSAWQRLAVSASRILAAKVKEGKIETISQGMQLAFGWSVSLRINDDGFRHVSGPWVETYADAFDESTSKTIHFNLMTGQILVDGKCPMHLPARYLQHKDFRALFGGLNPSVIALDGPTYQYQFRHAFKEFLIEVGLEKAPPKLQHESGVTSVLHVRATTCDTVQVLVPREVLTESGFPFPQDYLDDYFHWHVLREFDHRLDFYPRQSPWNIDSIAWRLEAQRGVWLLKQPQKGRTVIPMTAVHYEALSEMFQHFRNEEDLRVMLNHEKGALEIRLGTLGLNFYVESNSTTICSVEYEDMCIDHSYSISTLIGFRPKLVLCNRRNNTERILLVADGQEQCSHSRSGHTNVTIKIDDQATIQAYTLNEDLGQLNGNQTWRSKVYLAYLHALTSHCLPDPFTSCTGQETALDILTSGTIMSFQTLEAKDYTLLEKISKLCPERQVKKRAATSLPTHLWNSQLKAALHHEEYWFAVKRVIEYAEKLNAIRNSKKIKQQNFSEAEGRFREAEAIRLACFRNSCYASHTNQHDTDYYFRIKDTKRQKINEAGKIEYNKSPGFRRAFRAAFAAKHHARFRKSMATAHAIRQQMTKLGTIKGETKHYDASNFRYSAEWHNPQRYTLVEDFCSVHEALQASSEVLNPYRLRLWLSTIASGREDETGSTFVPILSAIVSNKVKAKFLIPTVTSTNPELGCEYSADQIAKALYSARTFFQRQDSAAGSTNEDGLDDFITKQNQCIANISQHIASHGLAEIEEHSLYFDFQRATRSIDSLIKLASLAASMAISDSELPEVSLELPTKAPEPKTGHISVEMAMKGKPTDFRANNEWRTGFISDLKQCRQETENVLQPALQNMPEALRALAKKQHEIEYVDRLERSVLDLRKHHLTQHTSSFLASARACAKQYRAEIVQRLDAHVNEATLTIEIRTIERFEYADGDFPDAVLLEIDHDMTLRENQLAIAREMKDPQSKCNTVMQLNMGEGKSSVIIPILSASLAQGDTLVRVFVGKHQSSQMMDTMTAALGGLINRPVFRMPFNRDARLSSTEIMKLKDMLVYCVSRGGVLLLQPEHHLSLLLSVRLNEQVAKTKHYVNLLRYLRSNCRDIIDESDEILSPTYELLYTIGTPSPVDFAPDRWLFHQGLLQLVAEVANPKNGMASAVGVIYEENSEQPDAYPEIRFVTASKVREVLTDVARAFLFKGIAGFPVNRYSETLRSSMLRFITGETLDHRLVSKIEKLGPTIRSVLALLRGCISGNIFHVALGQKRWRVDYGHDSQRTPATRLAVPFAAKDVPKPRAEFSNIDIVIVFTHLSYYKGGLREGDARDLIEHLLASDDGHEVYPRWFGKQSNMPQPERSLKTVNLQDEKQFYDKVFPNIRYSVKAINYFLSRLVFPTELGAFNQHMAASGWDLGERTAKLTTGFSGTTDLCAVLPLSMTHCDLSTQQHTDALVINNVLDSNNTVVSVRTALNKDNADGVDMVDHIIKNGQVRVIIDVGAQVIKLSNRQVAEKWLKQTEDPGIKAVVFFDGSDSLSVLDRSYTVMPLNTSVFAANLDACAVFLDEAHTRGTDLRLPREYKAAVTLGPGLTKDRLTQACMRMRSLGKGQTLTFYVGFEIEIDIRNRFDHSADDLLTIDDIIKWSITQTWTSLTRQMPLWAKQGVRHKQQNEAMDKVFNIKPSPTSNYEGIEDFFIQNGSSSIWKSYAPRPLKDSEPDAVQHMLGGETDDQPEATFYDRHSSFINKLNERCNKFGCLETTCDNVDETCEREVAPEVEDEKQVSKPPKPEAAKSDGNQELLDFIKTGRVYQRGTRLETPAESLQRTTLAGMSGLKDLFGNLLVTLDFSKSLEDSESADSYQKPVANILHVRQRNMDDGGEPPILILSQYDVDTHWKELQRSKLISLQMYSPKVTLEAARGENMFWIFPKEPGYSYAHSTRTQIALDLFAGQLYFASYEEYVKVSSFLGLAHFDETAGIEVEADGFIPPLERRKIPAWHRGPDQLWDTFERSPVPLLKHFLTVIRNHGAGIEHTHMGQVLDGERLGEKEFGRIRRRGPADLEVEEAAAAAAAAKKSRLETKGARDERKKKRDAEAIEDGEEPDLRELEPEERPAKRAKVASTPAAVAAMEREAASKRAAAADASRSMSEKQQADPATRDSASTSTRPQRRAGNGQPAQGRAPKPATRASTSTGAGAQGHSGNTRARQPSRENRPAKPETWDTKWLGGGAKAQQYPGMSLANKPVAESRPADSTTWKANRTSDEAEKLKEIWQAKKKRKLE